MAEPHKCPVCEGTGIGRGLSSIMPACGPCGATGIVWDRGLKFSHIDPTKAEPEPAVTLPGGKELQQPDKPSPANDAKVERLREWANALCQRIATLKREQDELREKLREADSSLAKSRKREDAARHALAAVAGELLSFKEDAGSSSWSKLPGKVRELRHERDQLRKLCSTAATLLMDPAKYLSGRGYPEWRATAHRWWAEWREMQEPGR